MILVSVVSHGAIAETWNYLLYYKFCVSLEFSKHHSRSWLSPLWGTP